VTSRTRAAALLAAAVLAAAAGCTGGGSGPGPQESPSSASPTASGGSGTPAPEPTRVTRYTGPPAALPTFDLPLATTKPPWSPPAAVDGGARSADYVTAAGLPWGQEELDVHYHAHLDVIVDGESVDVPAGIGFVAENGRVKGLSALHTHDPGGVIHIESAVDEDFLLGQFFVEWGVRFTKDCLGPYCAGDAKELAVFVDGERYDGDPTRVVFADDQEVAVVFGDRGNLPEPPSAYDFPEGL
jgi:hypothetical protein